MHWLVFFAAIDLFTFCYAQKYDATCDTATLNFSSTATASCGGCTIQVNVFDYDWYDQSYTHVAATIVKLVNNATNVTITSTIQGGTFELPASAAADAVIVSDSVITTNIGGTSYTLTYPKQYNGVGRIERYSQSPITNGNGTVKCVATSTALTHAFLIHEDVSNGLELSAFIDRDIDRACKRLMVSPPEVLVRVSTLTAITTQYANTPESKTSAAKNASPSISLSPPTVPRTSSPTLMSSQTVLANSPTRGTADSLSIATKSTPVEPSKKGSASQPAAPTSIALSSQPPASTQSPQSLAVPSSTSVHTKSEPRQEPKSPTPSHITVSSVNPSPAPVNSNAGPARSDPGTFAVNRITTDLAVPSPGPASLSPQSSLPQAVSSPASSEPTALSIAETTISRGGQSATVLGTPVSFRTPSLFIGTNIIPVIPVSNSADSDTALGSPSVFSIARTTLTQGGPAVTISSTKISLGHSNIIVGSSTLKFPSVPADSVEYITTNPTGVSVASTFITRGAIITISGKPVSLGSSSIVIGAQTVPLPSNPTSWVFSVAGQKFTANPTGFLIGSTSILSNGPAVTVSGTRLSLGASGIVIGTKTIALPSYPSLPVLTVAKETFTVNPTGFLIGSASLSPNGAPVTISGTPISLGSSDLVIGTGTIALPAAPSILTVDGQRFTANPSGFLVGQTSLLSNGPAVTVSRTRLSLGASGIVIGTKTIALPSYPSLSVLTVAGETFTANPAGFLIGSATLSPNGPPITISGTPISLGSSDIVLGTRTIALPAAPSILTIDGQKFTANPSGFSIGNTEIQRGGSPVTISGTPISLGDSAVVLGSSTVPFASVTNGLGPAILLGLGVTATPTATAGAVAGNQSEPFTGAQIRMEAPMILLASCVGLVGLVWA